MTKRITIIGAGPGGYTAAFEAAKKGAEVTLIDSNFLGGTCLNWGCIPTKTIKSSAEIYKNFSHAKEFGINLETEPKIDMEAVIARKNKVVNTLRGGLEKTCAKLKVKIIIGTAKIIKKNLVRVEQTDGNIQDIESDVIIIATGSSPLDLPHLPIDHKYILSSTDALDLTKIPKSVIIVGAGVIGCEFAFIYQAFGSQVTLVEGLDRVLPLPSLDEEMSKITHREMKKAKINVELAQTVKSYEIIDGKIVAHLEASPFIKHEKEIQSKSIEAEIMIMSIGRVPNTKNLGLEELGIKQDSKGYIISNEYLETNIPNIYAIGDVLGPSKIMLAHMAGHEAMVAIDNIFGNPRTCSYFACPSAIFVSPEIGSVGFSEKQAIEQGYKVQSEVFQFRELGKAQAMGELAGAFKIIVDKNNGKILGAHIAGAHATDLIAELTFAIEQGMEISRVAKTIHAHPTLAEGIFEAAHMFNNKH